MDVSCIMKQFLTATPLNHFVWNVSAEEWLSKNEAWQMKVLNSTLLNPLLCEYPAKLRYKREFLKMLIKNLEGKDFNARTEPILDELYEICSQLMLNEADDEEFFYKIYTLKCNVYVPIKESACFVSNGSTGLITWQAAKTLAEWMILNKDLLSNKKVLELGSGLGLTGIVACKMCNPACYVFTDSHPQVLQSIKHNITVNFPSLEEISIFDFVSYKLGDTSVSIVPFNWDDRETLNGLTVTFEPQVILAADVLYDVSIIPSLVNVLNHFLRRQKDVTALVSCTVRVEETIAAFLSALDQCGLTWTALKAPMTEFIYDTSWRMIIFQINFKH